MNKINNKILIKYIALFFAFVILGLASVGKISPFLYAFFFACLFVGCEEKIIAGFTLISALIKSLTLQSFLIATTVVAVGLIVFYIHKFLKQKFNLWTLFFTYLVSLATYIYYNYSNVKSLIYYLVLGVICLYAFIVVLQVLFLRKNCFKLTLDESICFLFFIALLGLGLAPFEVFNIFLYRAILMLIIFVMLATGNPTLGYAVGIAFAFGVALNNCSLIVVAEFGVLALISSIFSMPHKIYMVAMSIIAELFIQLFFFDKGINLIYDLSPIISAGVIFILIPNKLLNRLSDLIYIKKSEISSRSLINITRKNIRKRMSELSNVFFEMKQIHLNMIKKDLTKDELIKMLTRELTLNCCKDCLDKNRCTRALGTDNKSNLEQMVEIALTKGKLTLLDLPTGLTNRCGKINSLVNLTNRLTDEYKQYHNMVQDVNNVKILLADQMGAVSKLLLDIGDEIDTNVTFDIARENKIISRLLSLNQQCKEVLLYTEKNQDVSAVLIVKNQQNYNIFVEKVVSETLKLPMKITNVIPVENSDFLSVTLRKINKYDCIFGLASCNKSGNAECGDCHSIIRLGADKFLLALCDGMGTGKTANKMSVMTLGLIENFYKVGFDNDTVLESVNKLLAINNQEQYSTLDVCLLDLDKSIADFIKVGAPFGVVKHDGSCEIIEGGALPIGALDTISPAIYKTSISTKDIVIMATDGIIDAFDQRESLVEFVENLSSNNPQLIAEAILNEAIVLSNHNAKDDMTVLVARIYLKNND